MKVNESYGLTEGGSPLRPPIDGRPVPRGSPGAQAPEIELKMIDASGNETQEEGENLLERTMVLYGTCMGSANSHANTNLPVLLAGGGFRHGQHLAFDRDNNYPLTNLFVSMLQRLGIETREFSTGKGTIRGLEMS